jgi:hypothetical protein
MRGSVFLVSCSFFFDFWSPKEGRSLDYSTSHPNQSHTLHLKNANLVTLPRASPPHSWRTGRCKTNQCDRIFSSFCRKMARPAPHHTHHITKRPASHASHHKTPRITRITSQNAPHHTHHCDIIICLCTIK